MADEASQLPAVAAIPADEGLRFKQMSWPSFMIDVAQYDEDVNGKLEFEHDDAAPPNCTKFIILDRSVLRDIKDKYGRSPQFRRLSEASEKDWEYEKKKRGDTGQGTVDVFTRKVRARNVTCTCHLCNFFRFLFFLCCLCAHALRHLPLRPTF